MCICSATASFLQHKYLFIKELQITTVQDQFDTICIYKSPISEILDPAAQLRYSIDKLCRLWLTSAHYGSL